MSNTANTNLYKRVNSPNPFLFGCSAMKNISFFRQRKVHGVSSLTNQGGYCLDGDYQTLYIDSHEQWLISEPISYTIFMVINLKIYPSGDPIRIGGLENWLLFKLNKLRLINVKPAEIYSLLTAKKKRIWIEIHLLEIRLEIVGHLQFYDRRQGWLQAL
ncbi:hypothetical protein RF11_16050 [Thelohanellus kitauei]|uniref:Uncharacterized protein n=1 Tax=Thelohanellus kitauei TaxID=669202 RepID=A0A0C2ID53_THEKT|nr:hypothetical protein RF11_16050 [Thelohanellus kitauei]